MKKILILLTITFVINSFAQKPQKIGYIDMEYILENVPEYNNAQTKLDAKISKWTSNLDKMKSAIETMRLDLSNEKALLTTDLIQERQEDIDLKQLDLKQAQNNYFGPTGELFLLRKQIVKPVQDQIYNALQEIGKNKKYDMILDKSDELIMLYTNSKFDVSELVLNSIVKDRRKKDNVKKKSDRVEANEKKKEVLKEKIDARLSKREQMQKKAADLRAKRIALKDSIRNARNVARAKKLEEIKNRKNGITKNKETKLPTKSEVKTDTKKETDAVILKSESKEEEVKKETEITEEKKVTKTKEQLREEKRKALQDRILKQKAKRDSLKQIAADKRAAKLAEIKARKEKLKKQ